MDGRRMEGEKMKRARILPSAVAVFFLINLLFWGLARINTVGCVWLELPSISHDANATIYYYTGATKNPFDKAHCIDFSVFSGNNGSAKLIGAGAKDFHRIRINFKGEPGTAVSISNITAMTSPLFEYVADGKQLAAAFTHFAGISEHSANNGVLTIKTSDKSATMTADYVDLKRQWNPVGILFVGLLELLLFGLVWCASQNYIRGNYVPYTPNKIAENQALDIAKFICAFLIIAIHVGPFVDINYEINYFIVQILANVAVPLFFTISGYFFCAKLYNPKTGKFQRNDAVLNRYFSRIAEMYLIWNLFYLFAVTGQNVPIDQLLWSFLAQGGFWQLWYLWALALAVFALYHLLCRGVPRRRLLILSAIIYMGGVVFDNGYAACVAKIPFLNFCYSSYQAYLPHGGANALFFAFPFVYMGALFAMRGAVKARHSLLKATAAFLLLTAEIYTARQLFHSGGTSLWIFLPAAVYFIFAWLLQQNRGELKNAKKLRAMSSLIYLIHTFFLSETVLPLGLPLFQNNKPLQYLFVCAASCVFAEAFLWASRKFSILKRLY